MTQICKRCLLAEMQDGDLAASIYEYIAAIPAEIKADDALMQKRLGICRRCDNLISGMCRLCGCYVEVRAAKQGQSCPNFDPKW